jgi:hypothetical protein
MNPKLTFHVALLAVNVNWLISLIGVKIQQMRKNMTKKPNDCKTLLLMAFDWV